MKRIISIRCRISRKIHRLFRPLLYRFVFGQGTLLSNQLSWILSSWDIQQGMRDIPLAEEAWEAQYSSKKWKYLAQMNQLARYSIIIGYLAHLRPGGAILDVGCGEGILFERFRPYGYSKYVGIDISETSLTKLFEKQDEKTFFVKADAETYNPKDQFDIIVFNEILYYFHEPLKVVERYSRALKKDGILVVSTFTPSERAMSILQRLKTTYSPLDEIRAVHEETSKSWICSVLVPIHKG